MPFYGQLVRHLAHAGADWVQFDEPAPDLAPNEREALWHAYGRLTKAAPALRIMLASCFGSSDEALDAAIALPVAGLHLNLVQAPSTLEPALKKARPDLVMSLGVID